MRERSHWGWGWADKFGSRDERAEFGGLVTSMLGFACTEPREPVALNTVTAPPSRIAPPFEFCTIEPEARLRHTHGRAYLDVVRGFRGDFDSPPDAVATPATDAEVAQLLDWASDANVAVVPYGGGTSVVGGVSTAIDGDFAGVVSLDLRELSAVLEIDEVSLAARIQAGATGPAIEQALGARGLTLRHYPQSFEFSTLGGWIATRAGGHFATVRTHIDDFVESVRVITPSGALETRRFPASGAGPAPERLILGSEGTLGVITDAWMRVQRRPQFKSTASYRFERWRDAVSAVRALAQSGLEPANCRLLDKYEAMMNRVTGDGTHVLIVGFESATCSVKGRMALAQELCESHGGSCPEGPRHKEPVADAAEGAPAAAQSWKDAFFEGPYLQSAAISLGIMSDTFESAVTWDRFDAFHRGVKEAVVAALNEVCGGGFVTCRFTHVYPDGVAPYYSFVAPVRAGSELAQWREVKAAASDAVHAHGGTITHHHAVGRTHRPWYDKERPELFAAMLRAAKQAVDPSGILNPGVLVG